MKRFLSSTKNILESFTTTNTNVTTFMSSIVTNTNTRHLSQQSQLKQLKPLTPQHCDIESNINNNNINGSGKQHSSSSLSLLQAASCDEEISLMIKDMIKTEVNSLRSELSSVNTELKQMKSKERRQELVIEMLSQKLSASRESNSKLESELHRVENELHIIKSNNGTQHLQGQFMMRNDGKDSNDKLKSISGKNNVVTNGVAGAINASSGTTGINKPKRKYGGLKTSMEVDLY